LLGKKGNDAQGYFLARLRKARLALEELEKHREAEPGRPAFVGQQYSLTRQQGLTTAELRRLLGFVTRAALDGFLKAHGVYVDYTLDDLERDRRDLSRLGL
jgi:hypothetical protein